MAGERLAQYIKDQHTPHSERADITYGVVQSASPLKIQVANNMIFDENFLILGKHIGKFKVKGKAKIKSTKDTDLQGDTISVEYEFDNSLKAGDKVMMIRRDGGQEYYVLEREGSDGFGF